MTASATDPIIGRLIDGRYRVRSRIARGGMATVYVATDLRLERRVAIKIMHHHLADDASFRARFIQEARSAARLGHPNVVSVFDQGQDEDSAYLVMEYLPGITLRELLQEYGSLTPEQTMDITEALLSGLAAAHKAGIVHRDLKPENVLLADDGRIKIGDFGLARAATANTATGAALMGTIAYLSPELVTRGTADTRSDIYAVGIMMYEMLTGEQPFTGEQPMQIAYQHANDQVPTPSSKNPKVPAELDELVLWATARDPDQRPRDARLLLEQLYETQEMLRTALPGGGAQRTRVLPSASTGSTAMLPQATTGETQVLSGRTARVRPTDPTRRITSPQRRPDAPGGDSTSALTVLSDRRRVRGLWLAALVLLLAGLAAGTGWYFGPGPGGHVTVPRSLVSAQPAVAKAALTRLGFELGPDGADWSRTVATGAVVNTSPAVGASLNRGAKVSIVVSKGPQPFPVPTLAGQTTDAAVAAIRTHWTYDESKTVHQFNAATAEGTVLSASVASGTELPEGQAIELTVSAGKLQSVAGKSIDEATAALTAQKLVVNVADAVYSDDVPAGAIVSSTNVDGADGSPLTWGDTVTITPSKGPAPVQVPDLKGTKWSVAKKQLTDLGLQLDYAKVADIGPNLFVVSSVSQAGQTVPKGTTVKVTFSGF